MFLRSDWCRKKNTQPSGKFDRFIFAVRKRGGWATVWQSALKDTFEWDVAAFQWLLFRQTAPERPDVKTNEGARDPKEWTLGIAIKQQPDYVAL